MAAVSKEMLVKLAYDKHLDELRQYFKNASPENHKNKTRQLLNKPDLTTMEKIILVANNQHNRLTIIKRVQQHTYDHVFLAYPKDFFNDKHHYDWWIFPMHVPPEWRWQDRNYEASINSAEASCLLSDCVFVRTYINSVTRYMNALIKHGWNKYPVRYARMLHSLGLFIAAAEENGMNDIYVQLCDLGSQAVAYAKEQVVPLHSPYDLLDTGLKNIENELNKLDATVDAFLDTIFVRTWGV